MTQSKDLWLTVHNNCHNKITFPKNLPSVYCVSIVETTKCIAGYSAKFLVKVTTVTELLRPSDADIVAGSVNLD